tara:strand:+ start:1208 stop:1813 length:606 start_codon:yes stop_codon:yes gene_type:complete
LSRIIKNFTKNRQFELFSSSRDFSPEKHSWKDLEHSRESILLWREKINQHQKEVLDEFNHTYSQQSLINNEKNINRKNLNPFLLCSNSINFWRSNKAIHNGPAIYFVIDTYKESQIILYIGETYSADKRWKGEHDCKIYINNYKESTFKNNIKSHIDIRFSIDVPKEVKSRRKLEQQLIWLWLPPFNKETKSRWTTTFTNQ